MMITGRLQPSANTPGHSAIPQSLQLNTCDTASHPKRQLEHHKSMRSNAAYVSS